MNLKKNIKYQDLTGMQTAYQTYLDERGDTYMVTETGKPHDLSSLTHSTIESINDEGYAGVALDLIEGLIGNQTNCSNLECTKWWSNYRYA